MKIILGNFEGELKGDLINLSYNQGNNLTYSTSIKVPKQKEQALDLLDSLQSFLTLIRRDIQE